jgi:hypothetical protein
MIVYLIAALLVIGGLHFYLAKRLYQWFGTIFSGINLNLYIILYVIYALIFFVGFLPFPQPLRTVMGWLSAYWMGFTLYLLMYTVITDAAILTAGLTNLITTPIPQKVIFFKSITAIALTLITVLCGTYNGGRFKHVTYEIELNNAVLNNLKIVLISDSHIGAVNHFERNLHKIVEAINAQNPDIVCLAGDIFNDDFHAIRNPERAASLLRGINAVHGVYACLGNHDGGRTFPQMVKFLEDSNIKLLNDDHVIIDGRFALFGRVDAHPIGGFNGLTRRDISSAIAEAAAQMPVIIMEHNPSHMKEYGSEAALIIAGHTHRGQIFPGNLMTRYMFESDYGHHKNETTGTHLIVTSGISTWGPPMRVGTSNEIVSIIIR